MIRRHFTAGAAALVAAMTLSAAPVLVRPSAARDSESLKREFEFRLSQER